jgi:hypothetical protein
VTKENTIMYLIKKKMKEVMKRKEKDPQVEGDQEVIKENIETDF